MMIPRLTSQTLTLVLAFTVAMLSSCFKVAVPENYDLLNFAGLQSAEVDPTGYSIDLKWDAVSTSEAAGETVEYSIYFRALDEVPTELVSGSSLAGVQAQNLDAAQSPSQAGKVIATTNKAEYAINASELKLQDGAAYAFQVIASAGNRKDTNTSVFLVKYQAGSDNDYELSATEGNFQFGAVSAAFESPLIATLVDKNAKPVANEIISWEISSGGGTLSAATAITDSEGQASVLFTAGATSGTTLVNASWRDGYKTVKFTLVAQSSNSDSATLQIISGNFQTSEVGQDFANPLVIRAKKGALAAGGQAIAWTLKQTSGLTLSAATTTTDSDGYSQIDITNPTTAGSYVVSAALSDDVKVEFLLIVDAPAATTPTNKIIKIVATGAGAQAEVATSSLTLGSDQLTVKAALYDFTGTTYISDVAVNWSLVGGGFNSMDFTGSAANTTSITFTPTHTGTTSIQAIYVGADTTIIGTTDATGFITVTSALVPATINLVSGDNQTDVVNNILATPLRVRVFSGIGDPVPGVGINFAVVSGGGTVITGQPVITDAYGYAEATVRLSTTIGGNLFKATVVTDNTLFINFNATGTVGAASKVHFSTQPSGAFMNYPINYQPVITILDAYNNLVTSPNYSVSLSLGAGTGILGGTLTSTSSNGIALFTNVEYDTQENGVTLIASSTGLTSETSNPFNVGPVVGSCVVDSGNWISTNSGCQDTISGLIWSNKSNTFMSWHDAVWDSEVSGGNAADVGDLGRTNDYDPASYCGAYCDNSNADYCKTLTLNGRNDWRLPTASELTTAYGHGGDTHISDMASEAIWSSSSATNVTKASAVDLTTGTTTTADKATTYSAYCVRGGRVAADRLTVSRQSGRIKASTSNQGVEVQVKDSGGNAVNAEGVTVTIATNLGTISGTTTATTDRYGKAILSAWQVDTTGTATLTVSATGLTSASWTTDVASTMTNNCTLEDSQFISADGGCKDLVTGLVWSSQPAGTRNWYDSIWGGSSYPSGNAAPDINDFGRINDLDRQIIITSYTDSTLVNYCHSLIEDLNADWRMPTAAELAQVAGSSRAGSHFNYANISGNFWSSTSANNWAFYVVLSSGAISLYDKSSGYYTVCVRNSPTANPATLHNCAVDDANFVTTGGGCKQVSTGLIWSHRASGTMPWYYGVWGGVNYPALNPSPDIYDLNTTTDMDGSAGSNPDNTYFNYCHDLVESGYSDWRFPTYNELLGVGGATKANSHFNFADLNAAYWTGASANNWAYYVNLSTAVTSSYDKNTGYYVVCVRGP